MSDDCFSPATQRMINSSRQAKPATATNESRPQTASAAASSSSAAASSDAGAGAGSAQGSNVQVIVRCRPPTDTEKRVGDIVLGCVNDTEVKINASLKGGKTLNKVYTFDQSFGQLATQEEVYQSAVKPLVDEVLAGFNCTVFAYGQTGTGKTYTMEGQLGVDASGISKHAGVIPRSVFTIFDQLERQKLESSVKVSFLELYNEELTDLLSEEDGNGDHKELRIFEDATGKRGMLVNNLEEIIVSNAQDVFNLMQKSWQKRRTAETLLNKNSSRSHCVFTITVHTKEYNEDGEDIIKSGKLYLVDLAGSECVGKSGAQNQRAKEAGKINQSLLTLGRVINALVDKAGYVPYRDSKLTRLLQESLGGRAKTVIIATVSPSVQAIDETMSTLEYAHRAKNIRNRPQVNQKMTRRAYMKELLDEIHSLKRENEVLRLKNGIFLPPEKYEALMMEQKGKTLQLEEFLFSIKAKETELKELQELLGETEGKLSEAKEEKALLRIELDETNMKLDHTQINLLNTSNQLIHTRIVLGANKLELRLTEKDLKNSTRIARSHAETEALLHSEIEKIIDTIDSMIGEKNELHEKINRKTIVENHNLMANKELKMKFDKENEEFKTNFNEFYENQTSAMEKTRSRVAEQYSKSFASASNAVLAQLSSFKHSHSDKLATANSSQRAIGEAENSFRSRIAEQAQTDNSNRSALASNHFDSNSSRLDELARTVDTNWKSQTSELFTFAKQYIESNAESSKQFHSQLGDSIDSIVSHRADSNSALTSALSSHSEFVEEFLARQSASIKHRTAELMKTVVSMISEHENVCQRELKDGMREFLNQIGQTKAAVAQANEKGKLFDEAINSVRTQFAGQQNKFHADSSANFARRQAEFTELQSAVQSKLTQFQSKIVSDREEFNASEGKFTQNWQKSISDRNQSASVEAEEQAKAMNEVSHLLVSQFDPAVANLCSFQSAAINDFSAVGKAIRESESALKDFHPQFHRSTASIERSLDDYLVSAYRIDQPTGRTPIKREVQVKRKFPVTLNHSKIIENAQDNEKETETDTTTATASDAESLADEISVDENIQLAIANDSIIAHQPLVIQVPVIQTKTAASNSDNFTAVEFRMQKQAEIKTVKQQATVQTNSTLLVVQPSDSESIAAPQPLPSPPSMNSTVTTRRSARTKFPSTGQISLSEIEVAIEQTTQEPGSGSSDAENVTPNVSASAASISSKSVNSKSFNFARPTASSSRIRMPNLGEN